MDIVFALLVFLGDSCYRNEFLISRTPLTLDVGTAYVKAYRYLFIQANPF